MTYGKTYKRKGKKDKRRKLVIPYHPVPPTMVAKLRYIENFVLNPDTGYSDYKVFRANSVWAPAYSGGHSPIGYNEFSLFYNHYVVLSSDIKATFIAQAATVTGASAVVGIDLDVDNTMDSTTNLVNWQENQNSTWTFMGSSYSDKGIISVRKHYSTKRFFGATDPKDGNGLGADFGANPSKPAYYQVIMTPFNGGQDVTTTNVRVEIEYIVQFQQRVDLNEST